MIRSTWNAPCGHAPCAPPEPISGHEFLHLITRITRQIGMVPIPVFLINRPHSGPLTPSLLRFLFEKLPAARPIMMQCPIFMRVGRSGHVGRLVLLLTKANHFIVVELDAVDIGDGLEELRAHEGLGVLNQLEVRSAAGYASGVCFAEASRWDVIDISGVVRKPGDGEGAEDVIPCEVVFPETQPVKQDGVLIVAHLYVFIWIQEGHPVVLVAVIVDASCHCVILKPRTLILRHGFGRDVSEIEDFFGNVIIV